MSNYNETTKITLINGKEYTDEELRISREATEEIRHRCEVASIARKYHEALFKYRSKGSNNPEKDAGAEITKLLLSIEKYRGSGAAQRLREDTLKEITNRKEKTRGNKT